MQLERIVLIRLRRTCTALDDVVKSSCLFLRLRSCFSESPNCGANQIS